MCCIFAHEINNNRYEAKTIYTSFFGNRGHCGVAGFDDCISSMQQQYQQQKEREEDEKLNVILKYTRDTFKRFDLDETEIYQICESVRYFVANRQVLSVTEIHIKKRSSLTQISLKNFAWNIAFQYNIGRDMTTSFVMATFAEWFANSTFDTVRKNLRTTTGRHKIEIDEKILSKYGI